jgi:DNA-binding transcriptional MerR regulator
MAACLMKSGEVSRQLGVSYSKLVALLRENKIAPPAKEGSGQYVWGEDDVERARQALARRRGATVAAEGQ